MKQYYIISIVVGITVSFNAHPLSCDELAKTIDKSVEHYKKGRAIHAKSIQKLEAKLEKYDMYSKPWYQTYERLGQLKEANIALRMDFMRRLYEQLDRMALLQCTDPIREKYHALFMDVVGGRV